MSAGSQSKPIPAESSGSSLNPAPAVASSTAAGKKRDTGVFDVAAYLADASNTLEKIRQTAENVTTCQCQIDQSFDRAGGLLEALLTDTARLDEKKVQESAVLIDEALKNFHKHVLRFAIYGRPKAFIHRNEISAYFESFNVEMDKILKSFAVDKHPDVEDWETEYYQAKLDDETASFDQLWDIIVNGSDLKIIQELGTEAIESLREACSAALEYPNTPGERKERLKFTLERNWTTLDDAIPPPDFPKTKGGRLAALSSGQASSSSTSLQNRSTSESEYPGETAAARAKREEAERERLSQPAEYEEPPLPRWEPRRPPPGRGPGSIDGTMEIAQSLDMSQEKEDLPPSYS